MDFTDKTCVVTGGANGIGRCIAQSLVSAGARVAILDKDAQSGEQLAQHNPEKLFFFYGDAGRQNDLEWFAMQVRELFPSLDYLVNNACYSKHGLLSGCTYEEFNEVLRVGVTAPYYLTMLLKDHFAQDAAIVNISSTRAFQSQQDTESYTAAKGGITALTHALAMSMRGRARVNAVSPGWIETGAYQHKEQFSPRHSIADKLQHPVGRVGEPTDIAQAVLFLLGGESGFITGQNLTVDGGMHSQMIYHDDLGWTYDPTAK